VKLIYAQIGKESFLLIPPNKPYEFRVIDPDEHVWAIFNGTARVSNCLERFKDGIYAQKLNFDCEADRGVAAAMEDVYRWWTAEPIRVPLAENALERVLLLAELELGNGQSPREFRRKPMQRRHEIVPESPK
jgi:hypothetical protein